MMDRGQQRTASRASHRRERTALYEPIGDYALIGDTHSTALLARDGSIDWLCWPRHDSPALFLRLLDDQKGGSCRIDLEGLQDIKRRYLPQTNILETTFTTADGRAQLIDLMPVNPPSAEPEEGPDAEGESRLIRLIRCESGRIRGRFRIHPTFDYARAQATLREESGSALFEAGDRRLRALGSGTLRLDHPRAWFEFSLSEGESAFLVLTHGEDGERAGLDDLHGALERLDRTTRYWRAWSARCRYEGRYGDAVLRSALCLKLLTYSPSGGIIAAATTSLPEAVPGNRNYDYRFVWLRDASFTVRAFMALGYVRETAEFLRFLREADGSWGRDLRIMYAIDDAMPSEETLDHLEGWRGVGPVRIGNAACSQKQHDIYGELLIALCGFLDAVSFDPPEKVNDRLPTVLDNLTAQAIAARDEPDQGLWELRVNGREQLHSKAMIWLTLVHAAYIGRHIAGVSLDRIREWERIAAEIRAEYLDRAWSQERQAYTHAYGSTDLDAAAMRLVLFGAIDPDDPRFIATMEAIDQELTVGDLVYRYRFADGLEGDEATFTACAFWRVGCLALTGRTRQAKATFERLLARGSDVGLYAEEIDPESGEQRGNAPQGFTHMALIHTAILLERCLDAFGERDAPLNNEEKRQARELASQVT